MKMSTFRIRRRSVLAGAGAALASAILPAGEVNAADVTLPTGAVKAAKKHASKSKTAPGRVVPYSSTPEPWNPYFNPIGESRSEARIKLSPASGLGVEE
jgi:hypothetical protein